MIITKELPCEMTEEERRERRALVTEHALDLADIEAQMEVLRAGAKDHKKIIEKAAGELRNGKIVRDVRCHEEQVFADNSVVLKRDDTGEVVEERAMTGADRQLAMVEEEQGAPKTKLKGKKQKPGDGGAAAPPATEAH